MVKRCLIGLACFLCGIAESAPLAVLPGVETGTVCAVSGKYNGWPTVAKLSNGELIVAFSGDRQKHVCPYGKVQIVRSADNGRTWSEPQTVYSSDVVDCRDAGIMQTKDGTLVLNFFTSVGYLNAGYKKVFDARDKNKIAEDLGYWTMRSVDGGKTWVDKVRTASSSPNNVIQLRDGRLANLGTRNVDRLWKYMPKEFSACKKEVVFETSSDDGKSWKIESNVPVGTNVNVNLLFEPHVAELCDGTLVGLVRNCSNPQNSLQTVSHDGGKTWTTLRANGVDGYPPHLLRLKDGRVLATYSKRNSATGGIYAAISSNPDKEAFGQEVLLYAWNTWDFGYPSSVQLDDGSIYTVFYAPLRRGEKCVIKSARWRLGGDVR